MSRRIRALAWASMLSVAGVVSPLAAQSAPDDLRMFLVAHGDSVRLLLTESPPQFGGFVVYRRLAGGASSWELRTPEPIRRVTQPAMAAGLIGADLPAVRQALGTTEDGELIRRLQGDNFAAYVLSLLHPPVAVVLGRLFDDGGAQTGASYEYRVAVTDNRGEETGEQIIGTVRMADIVPAPPTGVTATPGTGGITVSWAYPPYAGDPRDVVIGFHVYRAEGASGAPSRITGRPVVRNDTGPLELADTLVANGRIYRYEVRALDLLRRESPPSAGVTVTAIDGTPPRAPTGVVALPGDGVVTVSWEPTPDTDVSGYHIERSTGLDQPYQRLTGAPVPANTPYEDRTAVGGTPYFYRVVAVDASGNLGRPSNAISALPSDRTPPSPPTGVGVQATGRNVEVSWTASPSADVRGYYVYRGDTTARLVRLVEQPVAGTSFVDTGYGGAGLAPGGSYTIRVSAVDNSYNESEPVDAVVAVPDDEPPTAPTGVTATNVLGRYVEVGWSASPSLDVDAYEVLRAATGQPATPIVQASATQRVFRDSTAMAGTTYTYQVVAVDRASNRSVGASVVVTFADPTPPPAPRYVAAALTATGVDVSWERVVAGDLVGYHVYRALVPTGAWERLTEVPVVELRFSDTNGQAEHYYSIRAVDSSANESASSPAARGRSP
jgi:fibronectin type 3 domain-containing protein